MSTSPPELGGSLESLQRMGESLLALIRNRFELFTVEWQEQKLRYLDLVIWLVLAASIGVAGVFIAVVTLALWLWQTAGMAGLLATAVLALAVAVGMFWHIRRKLFASPVPFAQTTAEFRKDGSCLGKNS